MSGPRFAPVDEDTHDFISLIAADPDYDRFLTLVRAVADNNGGIVTVNNVRAMCEAHGVDFAPRRYSSFFSRATAKNGPLEVCRDMFGDVEWDTCVSSTRSKRNAGKPQPRRRWKGWPA